MSMNVFHDEGHNSTIGSIHEDCHHSQYWHNSLKNANAVSPPCKRALIVHMKSRIKFELFSVSRLNYVEETYPTWFRVIAQPYLIVFI